MDTKHQLALFGLCVAVGFICGIAYLPFYFLRKIGKGKTADAVRFVLDIGYGIVCGLVLVYFAYLFYFPSFRVYYLIGYLLGGIIYYKILHRILAFFLRICYNTFTEWIKKGKKYRKNSKSIGEDKQ